MASAFAKNTVESTWTGKLIVEGTAKQYKVRHPCADKAAEVDADDFPSISLPSPPDGQEDTPSFPSEQHIFGAVWEADSGTLLGVWGMNPDDSHVEFFTADGESNTDMDDITGELTGSICEELIDTFDDGSGGDREPILISPTLLRSVEEVASLYQDGGVVNGNGKQGQRRAREVGACEIEETIKKYSKTEKTEASTDDFTKKGVGRNKQWWQQAPKAELHVHYCGSFQPKVLRKWAKLRMKEFPDNLRKQLLATIDSDCTWTSLVTCGREPQGLPAMLRTFDIFTPIIAGSLAAIEDTAREFVRTQAEHNITYTEARYSPHPLMSDTISADQVVETVSKAFADESKKHNIYVLQILCCLDPCPQWSEEVADLCIKYKESGGNSLVPGTGVVGIDIAAGEGHMNKFRAGDEKLLRIHQRALRRAKEAGIGITVHAGETPESMLNPMLAHREYGATRIGHGYHIAQDNTEIVSARNNNIHFEVCPMSSYATEGAKRGDHPLPIYKKHGLRNSISTDDPAVFHTDMMTELEHVCDELNINGDEFVNMQIHAMEDSFAPPNIKQEVLDMMK
eukprot:gene17432-767_t